MATLSGGKALEAKLAEIAKKMQGSLKVGFLEGATYPDGVSVAQVAFWNEFGTVNAPSRPFFRSMISKESGGWPELISKSASHFNYDAGKALAVVGEKISDDLKSSIIDWKEPENAQYTIQRKGFNKPLIDTGHMKDSISYEVKDSE